MGQQVQLLTNTVKSLNNQVSATGDYASDAIQQVRGELSASIHALSKGQLALNAGGDGNPGSATDHPLDGRNGKSKSKGMKEVHFAITCSYCDGEVHKSIQNIVSSAISFIILVIFNGIVMNGHVLWSTTICALGVQNISKKSTTSWNVLYATTPCTTSATLNIARAQMAGVQKKKLTYQNHCWETLKTQVQSSQQPSRRL